MQRGRLLFAEGWDLTNSTAWDTARWSSTTASCTVNTQSGRGRQALAAVGSYAAYGSTRFYAPIPVADFELTVRMLPSSVASENYAAVNIGDGVVSTDWEAQPANGYHLAMFPDQGSAGFYRVDAEVESVLLEGPAHTFSTSVPTVVRWRRAGRFDMVNLTQEGGIEAAQWRYLFEDGRHRGAPTRVVQLAAHGGNPATAKNVDWDQLAVWELIPGRGRRVGVR